MLRHFALLTALIPAAALAQAPTPGSLDSRGLWLDWRSLNAASLAAEAQRESLAQPSVAAARSLGERVGQLVAAGDCEGGERMAREAGDFPLLTAVREHCRSRSAPGS